MRFSRVRFQPNEKKCHQGEAWDEIMDALGFNHAQAREFLLGQDSFSFKQDDFRSS